MEWNWQFVTSVLQILVIDVVLSGDNAVVIALAAHRLPQQQRKIAILCGAAGAIGLRVLFTWILAQLLGIPLLRFGGGLILVWIAMKLLRDEEESGHQVRTGTSLMQAVWIIVMADFVMSLDNMLAVGGASEGHAMLILFGLFLSIAIIMTCSAVIADWMNRFPILVVLGAAVLAWTAAEMMLEDAKVAEWLVTHYQFCPEANWHEEFGGETEHLKSKLMGRHPEARAWWTECRDQLQHQHWVGWAFVAAVVVLVIVVPNIWNRLSSTTPDQNATQANKSSAPSSDPPRDSPHPDVARPTAS
jgi:YjbE family integral membrane protein